jgi:Zn-dependent peptidase ImmA (M78 family)/transcriptional regulator with XRE-family HTH domain
MKLEPLPITPAIVRWARERAGFSIEEMKKTFKSIEKWEDGSAFPSFAQFEGMADKFKIPVAVFFFPAPPNVPPISETFRTLPEYEFEQLPPRIRLLLRKAKAFQLNLIEMTGGVNPARRHITRDIVFDEDISITAAAQRVRRYLDISIEEQSGWPSDEAALEKWRKALQDVGVSIFKDAFKVQNYSGFCLYDDEFPLIYVNNSNAKTRQIFTLFHELAHLLFHTSGIDLLTDDFIQRLPADDRRIETICNRFAAEFLVPETAFNIAFEGRPPTEATAEHLADLFHVSRESIYRKFLDRNLISHAEYERARVGWAEQQKTGEGGGNYYYTKIAYLGSDYVNLALSQYYQNSIDAAQLAEYLDIKPRNISTFEEYALRG